eukprot:683760-Amphidinium_carterae.2
MKSDFGRGMNGRMPLEHSYSYIRAIPPAPFLNAKPRNPSRRKPPKSPNWTHSASLGNGTVSSCTSKSPLRDAGHAES